jgi:hypothetical protein
LLAALRVEPLVVMYLVSRTGMLLVTVMALSAPTHGQDYDASEPAGGPFSRVAVPNAPFSADAITKLRETLPDRSVREQTLNRSLLPRFARAGAGGTRQPWGQYVVVQLFFRDGEPVHGPTERMATWVLDPVKRTYRFGAGIHFATELFNREGRVALPVGKACFQTAPPVVGNTSDAERLQAVSAQVLPDLGVVIASHRSDFIGSVDYELTNIPREEPPAELFGVPSDSRS